MQEKVEKFIYYISEGKYRVKFLKVSKKDNIKINVDSYIYGSLDEARKFRDEQLKKYNIPLEVKKVNKYENIFEEKEIKPKERKPRKQSSIKKIDPTLVDKYIYEIEKGKKYRIFIRKGGSKGQKGDYFSEIFYGTLAQAKKKRDEKLAEFKLNKGVNNKSNIKFIDFARIYYKEYAEKECSPTTVDSGKDTLALYVLPVFANTPLNKIDALSIQKLMNDLKNRDRERRDKNGNVVKLSLTTVNGVYRLMRKILNKAIAWDYLEVNPVIKVKSPGNSKFEKQSYSKEELLHILDVLKNEDLYTEAMFTLSICSGIRKGELIGLHLEDVDFDNNIINVKRAVVWDKTNQRILEKDTKTKGSVRQVPIPVFCADVLKDYLKFRERVVIRFKRKNPDYIEPKNLFISEQNGGIVYPGTPTQKWLHFRRRHNELREVSLHGLRHSYCSLQMNDNPNLSPADVQKFMGHSQLSTTFIYTHSTDNKNDLAISVFDEFYEGEKDKAVNFNQLLSLYTGINFVPPKEINELKNFYIGSEDEKLYFKFKENIEKQYPFIMNIDITNINISNMWEFLDDLKNKYGNKFILSSIK